MVKDKATIRKLFFLLIFIPVIGRAEIRVETDTVTGMTRISSVNKTKNPFSEVIFTKSENGYFLTLVKTDKNCWVFSDSIQARVQESSFNTTFQVQPPNIYRNFVKSDLCSSKVTVPINHIVEEIQNSINVVLSIFLRKENENQSNEKTWKPEKKILEEWKEVIGNNPLASANLARINNKTTDIVLLGNDSLPEIGEKTEVDEPPHLIKSVVPNYPESARQTGLQANVIMAALVGRDGRVIKAKVMSASGSKFDFENPCLKAAYKMLYRPAMKDNKPVAVWIYYPVSFRLR